MILSYTKKDLVDILHAAGIECYEEGDFCRASLLRHIVKSQHQIVVAEEAIQDAISGFEGIGIRNLDDQGYSAYSFLQASLCYLNSTHNIPEMRRSVVAGDLDGLVSGSFPNGLSSYLSIGEKEAVDEIIDIYRTIEEARKTLQAAMSQALSISTQHPTKTKQIMPWLAKLKSTIKCLAENTGVVAEPAMVVPSMMH